MGIQDGTYAARPGQARVYENDKGSLVLCIEMQIEGGPVLKSFHTLSKADGTLMTRTIDNLKAWSGWDGTDPFWFVDSDLTGFAVEVVIENQPGMSDPNRMFPSVKWVNAPGGGGGGMAESDDRRTILAKYGGKLRANAGGVAVGAGASPRQRAEVGGQRSEGDAAGKGLPALPGRAVAPAVAPVRPALAVAKPFDGAQGKTSDMNTCWGLMCDLCGKMPKAQIEQEWFAAVGIIDGKDQADMTPDEWGRVEEFIVGKYGSGAVIGGTAAPRPAAAATGGTAAAAGDEPFGGAQGGDNVPF